jgi:hypothetical protein
VLTVVGAEKGSAGEKVAELEEVETAVAGLGEAAAARI